MISRRPALAPQPLPGDRNDPLVVVSDGPDLPPWVGHAYHRSGRQVRLEPAGRSAEDRIRTVTALAGRSVLVPGPAAAPARRGTPRVVAAIRDLPADELVLAEAAAIAEPLDADVVVVHGVPLSFGERSVGLDDAVERGQRLLDLAVAMLTTDAPGITVLPRLLRVRPHELVGEELDADLLVLGGPLPRFPARLGLVASSALQHAPCPVLLAARQR
jgi:nucleotide-binding universal stress UspA family protein